MIIRIAICLLLGVSSCLAQAASPESPVEHGHALVADMCAQCHAIGKSGDSQHIGAPAFRLLDRRLDLETLSDRLQEGLTSGHRDIRLFGLNTGTPARLSPT